ncbi:GDP-mannose pyrophosphatase NudK [Paenibacillus sp. PR3]|uniref:GDP-mannose pyrophosphatase NudK n=1 Tax=Paenibacillus terricola TaxID=2763503 RepID=A0ABR8MMV6_9BACL|nr:GDP-mannose pyrophosphatase NudK [Paenibacillus terricola]MBD3917345.1 GDP-mannose pyrophosphatase NudK [Paenibacillus terricola]
MNPKIRIVNEEILSDNWYELKKITYMSEARDGTWTKQTRESYDRGNGATILLYNQEKQTVILTRQFRIPTYVNGNETGLLIETCAGLLDKESAEESIRREAEEETGYKVDKIQKIGEAYMSPGSVTEMLHFFVAEYTPMMKISDGGGLEEEHENIEVLEYSFQKALEMIKTGEIKDGKTIMLLQYAQINRLFDPVPRQQHILVAGPYRSGTGDDPALIHRNIEWMTETALQVYEAGHMPVLGEWYALPLIRKAGSLNIGDDIFNQIFHPSSIRLLQHCDAVLRIGGPSQGADEMVRVAQGMGKTIYRKLQDIPRIV